MHPGRVEIRVFAPQQPVRFISACLSGKIDALQGLWPDSPKRFICSGSELFPQMTFEHYGIHDGDSIIALPRDDPPSRSNAVLWLAITRDESGFDECVRSIVDPATSREAGRLRDLHSTKIEERSRLFIKMCSQYVQRERDARSGHVTVLSRHSPISPSTKPLPMLWDVNSTQPCVPTA
jgi:hypothetical protein